MDVLNDQLIDIGLNVLGYLVAGALGMLIYSTFHGSRKAPAVVPVESAQTKGPQSTKVVSEKRNLEFVSFRQADVVGENEISQSVEPTPRIDRNNRADRVEIVRLAREMIKAGTNGETIRRTLPISEGELALLQIGK